MKKFRKTAVLALFMAASVLAIPASQAFNICGGESDLDSFLCAGLLVTLSPVASTFGALDMSSSDDRVVYVNQVREDSAEFVGADGLEAPSALLADAIQQVRQKDAQAVKLSDLQIAEMIVSAPN